MNYITCPHCGETYRNITAVHVCSSGPYAVKLPADTNINTKERIRELAQQAGIKYGVRDDVYYSKSFDGVYRLDMEKFAELIVKECADVVKYYHTRNESVTPHQIKQHFGVEE